MFNPAKAADTIKKEYIGYISTTFQFRNQNLQKKLVDELENTVSNGPFIEMKDAFKTGKTIIELIDEGILSPLFKDLEVEKNTRPNFQLHVLYMNIKKKQLQKL